MEEPATAASGRPAKSVRIPFPQTAENIDTARVVLNGAETAARCPEKLRNIRAAARRGPVVRVFFKRAPKPQANGLRHKNPELVVLIRM